MDSVMRRYGFKHGPATNRLARTLIRNLFHNLHPHNITTALFLAFLCLAAFPAAAQETSGSFTGGSVMIGYDNRACIAGLESAIRYTAATDLWEFCNGTAWTNLATGGTATPAAPDRAIQFNSGGAFAASDDFTWDGTYLTIANPSVATRTIQIGTIGGGGSIGTGSTWPMYLYPGGMGTVGLYTNQGMSLGGGYFTTTPPNDGLIVEGNVGIGTVSPGGLLHVAGTPAASTTSALIQATGAGGTFAGGHSSGQMLGVNAPSGFTGNLATFAANGTTAVEIRSNGRFVVSPNAAGGSTSSFLDINTSSGNIDLLHGQTLGTALDRISVTPTSITNSSGTMGLFAIDIPDSTTGTGGFTGIRVNKTGSGTGTGAKSLMDLQVAAASKFYVDATGNVGIGTAAPDDKLHVVGGLRIDNDTNTTNKGCIRYDGTGNKLQYSHDCTTFSDMGGAGASAINDLTDAFTDYVTNHNLIMGRTSAAALTAGAQYNTFIGEGAGATTANSTSATDYNTAVGNSAMAGLTTGVSNVAMGYYSLLSLTTGSNNVAIGNGSLRTQTTGSYNVAVGRGAAQDTTNAFGNVAMGYLALNTAVSKSESTAIGVSAMQYADSSTTNNGSGNTALGAYALQGSTTPANNTGTANTAVGWNAMSANTSGSYNTGIGTQSLTTNTTGSYNTAIGQQSLRENTTGNNNFASGNQALVNNTTGVSNIAVGAGALTANVAKSESTAVGFEALKYAHNTSTAGVSYNTALGYQALRGSATAANNTGTSNTAIGHSVLDANTSGSRNTAVGSGSMGATTSGTDNTATGRNALVQNTTGSNNTAVGQGALGTNTTKQESTAVGFQAMMNADSAAGGAITSNTAVGAYALMGSATASANTGTANTAVGWSALEFNQGGVQNTAVGQSSLLNNNFGDFNTGIGSQALSATSTGDYNTAVGKSAGQFVDTGARNTAVGESAMLGVTGARLTGSNNTAVGQSAGLSLQGAAAGNTFLGYNAGNTTTTGASNILIGSGVVATAATTSNHLNIGNTIYGDLSTGKVGIGTATPGTYYGVPSRVEIKNPTGYAILNLDSATGYVAQYSFTENGVEKWAISSRGTGDTPNNRLSFWNSSSEVFTISSVGNVGIGTNNPQSALHVPDGKYAQFEDNNAGAPPAADCDADTERGRMSIDTTNNRLYVCNGATRGWDYVALTN